MLTMLAQYVFPRSQCRVFRQNDVESSNTSLNYQRILNLNYPENGSGGIIQIFEKMLHEKHLQSTKQHFHGLKKPQEELRARIREKMFSLLVNKFILGSLTVLRMMYIFMFFISVKLQPLWSNLEHFKQLYPVKLLTERLENENQTTTRAMENPPGFASCIFSPCAFALS